MNNPQWTPKQAREEGFAHAVNRTQGILALPRPLAVEGEKVPWLKGVLTVLRSTLEAAERALAKAEAAQDRAVSIREEYADPLAADDPAEEERANPGPWHDVDGIYFEHGAQTFGPYATSLSFGFGHGLARDNKFER